MEKPKKKSWFQGINIPNDEVLNNCIHCGLCLPTCPTYSLTSLERSSPRGRIKLIKSVADRIIPISNEFIYEMSFCLDCQACETACPAGIKYGALVEAARAQIYQQQYGSKFGWFAKKLLLSWTFARQKRLKLIARILRWYQTSGLQTSFEKFRLLRTIFRKIYTMQLLAPRISNVFSSDMLAEIILPNTNVQYTVLFLTGCIMDIAFSDVNDDTIKLLLNYGCKVIIPKDQGCCGSLQAHNGDIIGAKKAAKHNIELFSQFDFDYIVMNSGGCGAYMKEYGGLFADDRNTIEKAKVISKRILDITEFLIMAGFMQAQMKLSSRYAGKRITYHDACHLIHTQKISVQPRKLIRCVPGVKFIELPEADWCCGSAGIYNVTHFDPSMQLLQRKVDNIRKISPDIIIMGNPGCMLQLQYGLRNEEQKIEILHTATFLRRACEA